MNTLSTETSAPSERADRIEARFHTLRLCELVIDSGDMRNKSEPPGQGQRLATIEERLNGFKTFAWIGFVWLAALTSFLAYQYFGTVKQQGELLSALNAKSQEVDNRLSSIEQQQENFLNKLLEKLATPANSHNTADVESTLRTTRAVLDAAKTSGMTADPKSLANLGSKLQSISDHNPQLAPVAWSTFLAALEYKSFLNVALAPAEMSALNASTCIKTDTSAIHVHVSDSLLANCAQVLDGVAWKGVTFLNVEITYLGGPVELERTRFENCTFHLAMKPASERLGETLLASNSSTISLP